MGYFYSNETTTLDSELYVKVRKGANIKNRYNQASHLTQDTNGKVTTSPLDITYESPFPAGDHKAPKTRRARKQNKNKTEITNMIHKRSTSLDRSVKVFYWRA